MRIFRKLHQKLNWTSTRYVGVVVGLLALTYLTSAVYHSVKPLPDGSTIRASYVMPMSNLLQIKPTLMHKASSNKIIIFSTQCLN